MNQRQRPSFARALGCGSILILAGCASQQESVDRRVAADVPGNETLAQDLGESMAAAMSLAQPGPEHEELLALAGRWTVASELSMVPGADPVVESGSATIRPVLGGRFVEIRTTGELFGLETESLTYLGFDRRRDLYVMVGLDTLGTYFVTAEGPRGADGLIRMAGTDPDPAGAQVYTFVLDLESAAAYSLSVAFEELAGQRFDPPYVMVRNRNRRVSSED